MIIDLILIIINIMLNIIIDYNKYSRQENLRCLRCKLSITWSDKFINTAVLKHVSSSVVFNGKVMYIEWMTAAYQKTSCTACLSQGNSPAGYPALRFKDAWSWKSQTSTLNRWEYLSDDRSCRRHTVQGVMKGVKKGNKQLEAKRQDWKQRETFIRHSSFVCHAKLGLAKPL